MADYLAVEPDDLRRSAEQHNLLAADLRKWGTIPQAWLDEFPDTHGTIADPMYGALVDYYNDRHEKAERLARRNEQTRDQLLRAAEELEQHDDHGRQQIGHAGGKGFDTAHGGQHGTGTPDTALPAPMTIQPSLVNQVPPGQPVTSTPTVPGQSAPVAPLTTASNLPQSPGAAPPVSLASAGAPLAAGVPAAPTGSISPTGFPLPATAAGPGAAMRPGVLPAGTGIAAAATQQPRTAAPGTASRQIGGLNTPAMTPNQRVFTPGASSSGPPPGPLPSGPLNASAHAGRDKPRPSLVVGDTVHDDLTLARTLLAAVLAAVGDSEPDVEWATAVAVSRRGPVLLLTSTAGRGWLPPGLYLPAEVIVPWRWYFDFRDADLRTASALVGNDDPAHTLHEFVAIAGQDGSYLRISALASSTDIPAALRTTLAPDTATIDRVSAADADADFSRPGGGLVDRLTAGGSDESQRRAELLSDAEIQTTCLALARARQTRARGHDGAITSHEAFIARRVDELLRLSTLVAPTHQTLRDMLYTSDQIADHPLMPDESARSLASEMERTG
ncbi:type VII secretion target [Nocardia sp. NPDC056000]|uniref:type VII secretion target n=1 Tax=Nocardia sp. NPDC056000 TaxID=3345674 RepID=UPI0035DC18FB